jgi:hypothetical protein
MASLSWWLRWGDGDDVAQERRRDTSPVTQTKFDQRFGTFLETHRETSLWYLRADYVPVTPEEQLRILQAIQRRCDLAAFKEAGVLSAWLSRHSSATSLQAR